MMKKHIILSTLICMPSLLYAQAQPSPTLEANLLASDSTQWPLTALLLEVSGEGLPIPIKTYCKGEGNCWDMELTINNTPAPVVNQMTIPDRLNYGHAYVWLTYKGSAVDKGAVQNVKVSLTTYGLSYSPPRQTKNDQPPLIVDGIHSDSIISSPWPALLKLIDQKLNDYWKILPKTTQQSLLAEQRIWLSYRDAECAFQAQTGISPIDRCLYQVTEKRLSRLPPVEVRQ
ncbi:lysozyme inhibitor LprI family protein [Aquipseudomonas alcaligenes]|uniref:lysozyme inhibitor LprI family protein n=1 Tax=Aquipseudomonas alcaligenes TaxID=43263 RepID=UPI001659F820|nr:lysozyme inhibitor LprI family protein [Pseudomonas alcaligenes]